MTDLRKLLSEARRDISHTMSCEYGAVIVRTVCCRSKATLRLEDMAPQLAAALLRAEEALTLTLAIAQEFEKQASKGSGGRRGGPVFVKARAALAEIKKITGGGE